VVLVDLRSFNWNLVGVLTVGVLARRRRVAEWGCCSGMSLGVLRGIGKQTKKGQAMFVKAVEKSQRLDSSTKKIIRDRMLTEDWKYIGRKSCVCGR
jgi:hypothetical protein